MPQPTSNILYITLISMMGVLTLLPADIYLPALPALQRHFMSTATQAQLTLSAFFLGAGISQLFSGPIIDRFGYKTVARLALIIFTIISFLCVLTNTLWLLIAYRFIQAISAGFVAVISRAVIVKIFDNITAPRIFLLTGAIIAISPGIAPIIGGYLTKFFNWQSCFIFTAIFGLLLLILVHKFLSEIPIQQKNFHLLQIIKTYTRLFKNFNFNIYLISRALIDAAYFAYITASPFIFHRLGYTSIQIGNFYWWIVLTFMAMAFICQRILKEGNAKKLISAGLIISLAGAGILILSGLFNSKSAVAIIVPAAIMTAGFGFAGPLCWSEAMAEFPHEAGCASSLTGFFPLLASAIAAALINPITHGTVALTGLFLFILIGISLLIQQRALRQK